jgi:hypothetical protein
MANYLQGLLGEEEYQPEQKSAFNSALLQAGLTGLMASGPSFQPVGTGQVLGQAGMAGLQAYQQGLEQSQQNQAQSQLQSFMQGGEQGETPDAKAIASKYRQVANMFASTDPAKAKLYLDMADKVEGTQQKFTGSYGNVAAELYGDMNVGNLTQEQRANVAQVVQQRELQGRQASAPNMSVNLNDPTAVSKQMMNVRNNYIKENEDASAIASTYQTLVSAAKNPNPINDISLVFGFYKMIDPASTVREGEYDTLLQSASIPDRIKNYVQKVQSGEKLTPKMRQEILDSAFNKLNSKKSAVSQSYNVHSNALKSLNIDPKTILSNPLENIKAVNIEESASTAQPNVMNLQQGALEELRRRGIQ